MSDENLNLSEKRESAHVNTGMVQLLELSDKDFNAVIIKML